MSERDEAAVPMDEIDAVVARVLGQPTGLRIQCTDRAGRGEKIVVLFEEGGTITIDPHSRKAGAARRSLIEFLERCEKLALEVRRNMDKAPPPGSDAATV